MPQLEARAHSPGWDGSERGWTQAATTSDAPADLSAPVRTALQYMTRHYGSPITLKDLSKVNAQTPSQMIRAFRKELGITPHAWLIRLRVERGTDLLEKGEPIASVAFEVGFVDQTHFTRHFKRVHGETPARFLHANRQYRGVARA